MVATGEVKDCSGVDRILLGKGPRPLWILSFALLVLIAIWMFFDPMLEPAVKDYLPASRVPDAPIVHPDDHDRQAGLSPRRILVQLAGIVILFALLLLIYGMWRGPKPYRSLGSLLMLTTIFCFCIGLLFSLSNISWYGKQFRVSRLIASLEPIVAELKHDWPEKDGQSPTLGPYKTYPLTNSRSLILLTSPPLSESGVRIASVTRSQEGALKFALAGSEIGDWLEWHPKGHEPSSFHGGLQESYSLTRQDRLSGNWYLVRYNW